MAVSLRCAGTACYRISFRTWLSLAMVRTAVAIPPIPMYTLRIAFGSVDSCKAQNWSCRKHILDSVCAHFSLLVSQTDRSTAVLVRGRRH
eukprot:6442500-Amphidinium_carterae.1